ncbi:MAG: hypothetical protein HWE22_00805 [Flavobacteriales bacterium]|nr:hypothetical protein [Flavobacteriales bacterium]
MANSVTIYLQSIVCENTSEMGHDEVYVKYSVDGGRNKRFPSSGYESMSPNDNNPWVINLPIEYKNTLVIGLYDSDAGKDDSLGTHSYTAADASKEQSNTVSNSNGAKFVLNTGPNKQ